MNKLTIKTEKRVIVTTDIHGCFDALQTLLEKVNFTDDDILVIAGDAIDRGPDSDKVLRFIRDNENVHCILGNHEDMALKALRTGEPDWMYTFRLNGGEWLMLHEDQGELLDIMEGFPTIIEIQKGDRKVGVVHAEPDTKDWNTIGSKAPVNLIWGRTRLQHDICNHIENIDEILVGHTIVKHPTYTGNVFHMDMGAFLGNELFHVEI